MLLKPRYDGPPIIAIEPRLAGAHPVVQQRQRLVEVLGQLSDDEWLHPSRCDAWTVQDVITHLNSTNGFWTFSIGQAVAGEPTRLLASFDPVASPAELVDSTQAESPAATFEAFRTSTEDMVRVVESLDDKSWASVGEAPPGHVPLPLVADHALWDSWVHERDIVLPLGRVPVEDDGEVLTCLRYAAALGQAFEIGQGGGSCGSAVLEVTEPNARIVVSAEGDQVRVHEGPAPDGAQVGRLSAVPLLEMLSRRDSGQPEPEVVGWLSAGLASVFDETEVPVAGA